MGGWGPRRPHSDTTRRGMATMSTPAKLVLEGIEKSFGGVQAVRGVNLEIPEGALVSFLGPSGCGKTTSLRIVAGLEAPTKGRVLVDGRVLSDERGVVPPERRGMGMVFQSYAVWPHMTVFDNVAFGLRLRHWAREAIRQKVQSVLELVNMAEYATRYPTQLSGGQQQRVALARALATEPAILLLDEPLSNLDALLREKMRFEIRSLQQRLGITTIYVTHSQEEALVLSDVVATMHEGKLVQLGPPEELYRRPRTRFVATFIGLANLMEGKPIGRDNGGHVVELPGGQRIAAAADNRPAPPGRVSIMIRPECIRLMTKAASPAQENRLRGRVESVTFTGSRVDYFVAIAGIPEPLRVQTTPPIAARPGEEVDLAFSVDDCVILED
jgi:ABC-type Fe3+/spermidine/putrescine transport system ATPase subunit